VGAELLHEATETRQMDMTNLIVAFRWSFVKRLVGVVACGTPHLGVWIEMCLWQENRQSGSISKLFHFIRYAIDNLFFTYDTHSISLTTYKFRTALARQQADTYVNFTSRALIDIVLCYAGSIHSNI